MNPKTTTRTIKAGPLFRSLTFDRSAIDEEARTVELSFSSEAPVERFFGNEILDHNERSVDLARLKTGGPLLLDHDYSQQIGVVEEVSIDADKRGRARVRFGRGSRANEIFQDVIDGIRKSVSVGYRVLEMLLEEDSEEGATYRVTRWQPFELSLVAVPADFSVGVGRSKSEDENEVFIMNPKETKTEETRDDAQQATREQPKTEAPATIHAQHSASDAVREERARVSALQELGAKHRAGDLANKMIREGASVADFNAALVERFSAEPLPVVDTGEIGMSERETKNYSVTRALYALANPTDRKAQEAAAFEFEASRAAAEKMGRESKGLVIPADVLQRDLLATASGAAAEFVGTDLLAGSMIDMLRNRLLISGLGSTTLSGLRGNVSIPRQTGGAQGFWVSPENSAATEQTQSVDQVSLSPKTVAAFTDYSRQLLLQSSVDVEGFIRNDLTAALATAIDLAAFYGSGAAGQPTGIANQAGINSVTFAAANPTYAEVVQMETEIATDNAAATAYALRPDMRGHFKTTEKFAGTGQTIWEAGNTVNGYRAEVSNQITSGDLFLGNWADLLVGLWGGLELQVNPYIGSPTGAVRIEAWQSIDLAVRHPESFCLGNDGI